MADEIKDKTVEQLEYFILTSDYVGKKYKRQCLDELIKRAEVKITNRYTNNNKLEDK